MEGGIPALTIRKNALVAVLFCLALPGIGACGEKADDGIPSAGSSRPASDAASGPSPAADARARIQQYVNCLREHGVQVADPEAGKQVQLNGDRPQDKEAAQACRQYLPTTVNGGDGGDIETMRAYSACMREHDLLERCEAGLVEVFDDFDQRRCVEASEPAVAIGETCLDQRDPLARTLRELGFQRVETPDDSRPFAF